MKNAVVSRSRFLLAASLAALWGAGVAGSPAAYAQTVTVTGTTRQTFTGWGANQPDAKYFYNTNGWSGAGGLYDRMFSDLKLTYLRMYLSPAFRPNEGDGYNIGAAYGNGGETRLQEVVDNAKSRNPGIQLNFTPWTPPAWMKWNYAPYPPSEIGGGINDSRLGDMAAYVTEFVKQLKSGYGRDVDWISVQNEPEFSTGYVSCLYTAEQFATTTNYLRNNLNSAGLYSVKLLGPDHGEASDYNGPFGATAGYLDTVFNNAGGSLAAMSMHTYHFTIDQILNAAQQTRKPMHMTEYSTMTSDDLGAPQAATMADRIAKDVGRGQAVAWYWWTITGIGDPNNGGLRGERLILTNQPNWWTAPTGYTLTKKFYAYKHITQNVTPGSVVRQTNWTDGQVTGVGFKRADGKFVAIVTNTSTATKSYTLRFDELGSVGGRDFTRVVIDGGNNEASGTVTFSGGNFSSSLAPGAVHVFVDQGGGTTTPPPTGGNLLVNPGFEGSSGWNVQNPPMSISTVDRRNGSSSLQISTTSPGWRNTWQSVSVTPNTNYSFTVYAKGGANFQLKVTNSGWTNIKEQTFTPNGNWTAYTMTFNSGSNSSVVIDIQDAGSGTTYIDDASVQ
jgi:O-glycosyl hydrolase